MRIIVIGGGISGLTAAYLAQAAGHDVLCVEPGDPGGLIRSERHDGFLCEVGPQAVLDNAPDTMALLAAAGLADRALPASPAARRRFIFVGGRLHPLPSGPRELLGSRLLSSRGKLRLLLEPFIGRGSAPDDDETVMSFGTRRLGAEAARVLLATLVIGIFAGAADDLAVASALPRLVEMERRHGSLFRALMASRKSGVKRGHPLSFPDGLAELPAGLARALGARWVRGRATSIEPRATGGWRVSIDSTDAVPDEQEAEAVVVATDASSAARLLGNVVPEVKLLADIPTAPIAICALGFHDAETRPLGMALDAYGFLVARGERQRLLGCQYESSTFAGRAPAGQVLLRCILGGSGAGFDPDIVDRTDTEVVDSATRDLKAVAGLARAPDFARVWRHPSGIPQPRAGYRRLVQSVDDGMRKRAGLHLLGHALRGVGVNESIRAASNLVRTLSAQNQEP